jgi:hypothetical protein
MLEFFILTPLPGSEDHKVLAEKGVWMDPDLNKYTLENVVANHAKMTKEQWQNAYYSSWDVFYNNDHLEQVLRRAYASGIIIRSLMPVLFIFATSVKLEGVHPLQWGIFRIKDRRTRRSGLPIESPFVFYPRYAAEVARKAVVLAKRWYELKRIVRKIEDDPNAKSYTDEAMTPVAEEDSDHMELYTQNKAARSAVERELRVAGVKPKGNGQPAVAAEGNGHGGNGHGNGHDDAERHDADRHHTDEHGEPISPAV